MRNAFIKTLTEVAAKKQNVLLLTGDLGFKVLDGFKEKFPERFFNVGVAEANMASVATGLALEGKCSFIYSIAPFVTMRCYEQIRNDICFHKANVKVVSVGGGYSYGNNGPTHHALTDIAIMRVLPEMTVVCPGDPLEASLATEAAANFEGPVYIRLGRSNEPVIHQKLERFEIGKGIVLKEGEDIALISTGNMLETCVRVNDLLLKTGLNVGVISLHTVKPLDDALLKFCFEHYSAIFSVEEHSLLGGLGGAILELASKSNFDSTKLKCLGVRDYTIHESGSHEYLRRACGLTVEQISGTIQKTIAEKKLC